MGLCHKYVSLGNNRDCAKLDKLTRNQMNLLFKALHPTIRGASMLAADVVIPVWYHLFSSYWHSNDTDIIIR